MLNYDERTILLRFHQNGNRNLERPTRHDIERLDTELQRQYERDLLASLEENNLPLDRQTKSRVLELALVFTMSGRSVAVRFAAQRYARTSRWLGSEPAGE